MNRKYSGIVKVGDIFAHPTIDQLASFIDEADKKEFIYMDNGELFSKAKKLKQQGDIK